MTHPSLSAVGPTPSLGLLVLRATLCGCLLWIVATLSSGPLTGLAGCLCAALVSLGYQTRAAALLATAVLALAWSTAAPPCHAVVLSGAVAMALALTGPGRYSVDAWRSARRIVVVSMRRRR